MPEEYLVKCQWLTPIEENSIVALDTATLENTVKFKECYYLHNNFVDYYNKNLRDTYGR